MPCWAGPNHGFWNQLPVMNEMQMVYWHFQHTDLTHVHDVGLQTRRRIASRFTAMTYPTAWTSAVMDGLTQQFFRSRLFMPGKDSSQPSKTACAWNISWYMFDKWFGSGWNQRGKGKAKLKQMGTLMQDSHFWNFPRVASRVQKFWSLTRRDGIFESLSKIECRLHDATSLCNHFFIKRLVNVFLRVLSRFFQKMTVIFHVLQMLAEISATGSV